MSPCLVPDDLIVPGISGSSRTFFSDATRPFASCQDCNIPRIDLPDLCLDLFTIRSTSGRNWNAKMTSSPAKNAPHIPSPTSTSNQLSSPRSTRTLRKLQSAHQLSSNYNALNAPSLISQQRQQQQRNTSLSEHTGMPPVPTIPAYHSPNKPSHQRTRSNSDAVLPSDHNPAPTTRRTIPSKRQPKDELRALITRGPKEDLENSLRRMRKLILDGGIETEYDGMVCSFTLRNRGRTDVF